MAKTIWKFELGPWETVVSLPKGSKILHIGNQFNGICIWVLVDKYVKEFEKVTFTAYGTGFELPDDPGEYLGTVPLQDGIFIWHVFRKKEKYEKTM